MRAAIGTTTNYWRMMRITPDIPATYACTVGASLRRPFRSWSIS
jgi:hypothetical protein